MQRKYIVFYDGKCNLCHWSVQFIIKRNKKQNIQFASLQSNTAKKIDLDTQVDSIQFFYGEKVFSKSDACIEIMKELNFPWEKLSYLVAIIPRFVRDYIYDFLAKNRYKFFGVKEDCYLPSPEERKLFLN